jgi:putative nucleotidyltransferase with HDIG domain
VEKINRHAEQNIAKDIFIAEDIYGKNDRMLLAKAGMLLSDKLKEKLVLHGVTNTRIGKGHERRQLDDSWLISPVAGTQGFKQFQFRYEGILAAVRQQLNTIITGGPVEEELILTAVSSLTRKALTKANVLNYIRYIRQGDDATYSHCLNVALLCSVFGSWLGMPESDISTLIIAGMLHDIGKTKVPPEILYKPGKLTKEEFDEVKNHTIYGYHILEYSNLPRAVKFTALMHHEKHDGKGYPLRISTSSIDKTASIVSICDIFEAMTADRIYRAKMSPFTVIKRFEKGDFGMLDHALLLTFLYQVMETLIGSTVLLDDGRAGRVVMINRQDLSRPLVWCAGGFVNLLTEKHLNISAVF